MIINFQATESISVLIIFSPPRREGWIFVTEKDQLWTVNTRLECTGIAAAKEDVRWIEILIA